MSNKSFKSSIKGPGQSAVAGPGFTRRKALKGAAAVAGLTAASSLYLPKKIYANTGSDHPLSGQSIDMSILGIAGWVPSALSVDLADEFARYAEDRYGYTPRFEFADAPFSALFQRAAASLSTRRADFNIIISDSQWLGALSEPGWIMNVSDIISEHPDLDIDFYEIPEEAYQVYPEGSGNKWGFPQVSDTIVLFVRSDLLLDPAEREAFRNQYGRDLPETFEDFETLTMDEFEDVAAFFTRPEQGLHGTTMQYSREYDFMTCYLYPFMFSQGGDIWDPSTGQVHGILNSEVNARALEEMVNWLQYMPDGAINYGISETIDAFSQGRVFSSFQWAAVGNAMIPEDMRDKVMVVPPPGWTSTGEFRRVYTIGGQAWVINNFNTDAQKQVAIDYMKWWYQSDVQWEFARLGGCPSDRATLDREGFEDLQPFFRAHRYMLQEGRSRDFWKDPNYSAMLSVQQEAFTSVAAGQTTDAMLALEYAACQQQELLYRGGRTEIAPPDACRGLTL